MIGLTGAIKIVLQHLQMPQLILPDIDAYIQKAKQRRIPKKL